MKLETDMDHDQEPDLAPAHRVRLAKLMLRLGGFEGNIEPGSWLRSHVRLLDRAIKETDRTERSEHWRANAVQAELAARAYLKAQSSGQPISRAAVAEMFGTSERSVSRFIQKLKTVQD